MQVTTRAWNCGLGGAGECRVTMRAWNCALGGASECRVTVRACGAGECRVCYGWRDEWGESLSNSTKTRRHNKPT